MEAYTAARKVEEAGGPEIPEDLLPPEMLEGYGGWYEDFWELSTERQIGMAEGEIPASVIARHTEGWCWEDAEVFAHCMRAMDRIYLRRTEGDEGEPQISARDAFRGGTSSKRGQ